MTTSKPYYNLGQIVATVGGYAVKDLKVSPYGDKIFGFVADPLWARPDRPFITAMWHKNGKCVNKTRPELNLW
jgi:hypothetical protein